MGSRPLAPGALPSRSPATLAVHRGVGEPWGPDGLPGNDPTLPADAASSFRSGEGRSEDSSKKKPEKGWPTPQRPNDDSR